MDGTLHGAIIIFRDYGRPFFTPFDVILKVCPTRHGAQIRCCVQQSTGRQRGLTGN
jgi:hypothetical protein